MVFPFVVVFPTSNVACCDVIADFRPKGSTLKFVASRQETHGIFKMQASNSEGTVVQHGWVRVVREYKLLAEHIQLIA